MEVSQLTSPAQLEAYDDWVRSHPHGSLWQSLAWKQYQEALGREVRVYACRKEEELWCSALVVIDRTSFGFSAWEVPRGPLFEEPKTRNQELGKLLERIRADAGEDRCLALYVSPRINLNPDSWPLALSGRHQYPEATCILDLTRSEEELLAQMKPKGRYNIRVAQKHGITVQESEDIDAFYALAQETAQRDGFRHLPKNHYAAFLERLPGSFLLLAFSSPHGGSRIPIAGLLGVIWDSRGFYYYGASSYAHRAKMAPYLLQWEAMRRCRAEGCTQYDLFGTAPPGAGAEHPWHGVSAFKEKFGGAVVTYPAEQALVLRPLVQKLLQWKRRYIG